MTFVGDPKGRNFKKSKIENIWKVGLVLDILKQYPTIWGEKSPLPKEIQAEVLSAVNDAVNEAEKRMKAKA